MPILIQCPSCERRLRVPDNLLGKQVKCPSCQTTFTAAEDGESEETLRSPAEERPAVTPRRRPAAPPPEEDEGYEEERPSRASRRRPPDEEDEEQEEDYEEEDRPRRRRRRRRRSTADAEGAVAGPAIALLITGILGVLVGVVNIIFQVANPNGAGQPFGGPPGGGAPDASFRVGQMIGAGLSLVLPILVTAGAIQMKRLQGYGLAMTAAIVAMVPCTPCCLLGLPFGIWALVVLAREDVKRAFS